MMFFLLFEEEGVGRRTGSWISLILMAFWLQASTRADCEGLDQETRVEEEELAELHGSVGGVLCFGLEGGFLPGDRHLSRHISHITRVGIHGSTAFIHS